MVAWFTVSLLGVWVVARPPVGKRARSAVACSVAGGRAGGTEDLHPVAGCDREQQVHVGGAFERRRQDAFGGGLADCSLESLELHRREADQCLRSAGLGVERVRDSLRAEDERA